MKKQMFFRLCMVLLLLLTLPLPARAYAPVETEYPCSITLHYGKGDVTFPDLEIAAYRIASVTSYGYFELVTPFSGYPVDIHNVHSQAEWKAIAETLSSYIAANKVSPTQTQETDEDGSAVFTDLQTGMYLITGIRAESDDAVYQFDPCILLLPTPQQNGSHVYDLEAKPKCSDYTEITEYSVRKIWKDQGSDRKRPVSITVEIYKDSVLQDTVTLSKKNNWIHSWKVEADGATWSVVETDVPSSYKVSITSSGDIFTITNTAKNKPGNPPAETGDTTPIQFYMTVMCISGCLLMILGTTAKRKQR